jgi:hypothetical protein
MVLTNGGPFWQAAHAEGAHETPLKAIRLVLAYDALRKLELAGRAQLSRTASSLLGKATAEAEKGLALAAPANPAERGAFIARDPCHMLAAGLQVLIEELA